MILSLLPVFSPYDGLDVPSYMKIAFDLHGQRIARLHEVFQDHVDNVFMENLHVAK